jgi:MFS family permease
MIESAQTPGMTSRRTWGRWGPSPGDVGFGRRFVTATSIGSVLNPINSSIIAVALVSIGQAFDVGTYATAWLVSALYLATAVGQPTMGKLADRLGARRVYLAGMALVAVGGVLGFLGPSLGVLIVARVVIGLGTSAAYPAAIALVHRQSERLGQEAPGGVLGALAIAGQVSMALGPPLGGLLLALGGWRSIFLVNLPLAMVGALFALAWLPADDPAPGRHRGSMWHTLDPPGLGLFVAALTSLLVFLMDLAAQRWYLFAVAVVLVAALIGRELCAATPFIDVRMLVANRALSATYARYTVTFLVNYCFIYGWTQWLEQSAGYPASTTGLLLMPSFVVAAAVSALASRGRRVRGPLMLGSTALVIGSASLLALTGHSPLWALVGVSVVFGVQNGLVVVANQAAMYAQAPGDQVGIAAGLLRTFMYLGAILSASLISITYRQQATDAGLHSLAAVLTVASVVLLVMTMASRRLPGIKTHPRLQGHLDIHGYHAFHLLQRLHPTDRAARPVDQRS